MKRRTLHPDELADLLRLFQWLHDNPPKPKTPRSPVSGNPPRNNGSTTPTRTRKRPNHET